MYALYFVAFLALVAQAYSQCIPPCAAPVYAPAGCAPIAPPCVAPAPVLAPTAVLAPAVVQTNNVAATLADTLSLLTVSSLLAEKLPFGCGCGVPAPVYPGCGCGGYGYVL